MNVPVDRKYTKEHEWVLVDDGVATVGISDYAQDALGDVVFVDLPSEGAALAKGAEAAAIESTKAAAGIYAVVTGKVTEVNPALVDKPELVNSDCYGEGWIYKITVDNAAELDELMDAGAYEQFLAGLDE
jgi:glycine cleavage system H protein